MWNDSKGYLKSYANRNQGWKEQITIVGAGETEFGPWKFTEPGTYEYRIYEVEGTNKNYKYDDRVYHLTYRVYYSGNKLALEETLVDDSGNVYDGTAVFEFTNIYIEPSIPAVPTKHVPGKPDTGDRNVWLIWAICGIAAAGIITAIVRRRKVKIR